MFFSIRKVLFDEERLSQILCNSCMKLWSLQVILNGSLLSERESHRKTKTKEKVINFCLAFVLEQDVFSMSTKTSLLVKSFSFIRKCRVYTNINWKNWFVNGFMCARVCAALGPVQSFSMLTYRFQHLPKNIRNFFSFELISNQNDFIGIMRCSLSHFNPI